MKKNNYYISQCMMLLAFLLKASVSFSQNPGLVISEFLANPPSTDSPYEYVELRATKFINFAITPYSVVVCNNGNATSAGWIAGGALSYGFSINTGTVNPGDVVYVGGTLMAPTGVKLRAIQTGTTAGDGFGTAATGGVFGNGGSNADGIAVFANPIASITNSTVPVDAVFFGTAIGSATVAAGGYELPVNDLYNGGKLSASSFFGPDPGSGINVIASGTFDTLTNTYIVNRTWTTGALTDGTSTVLLGSVLPPANFALSTDNQTILESIGTVTATISISNSNANPSSVEVAIIPFGTAAVGSDLAYATQTVTFPGNATGVKTLTITINDDALPEPSEYFVIRLQNPVNANLTGIKEQTIFIKDNENSTPVGSNDVSMTFVSSFTNGVSGTNSAEIVAHDPISQRLFVANSIGKKLDIIDFSNPAAMSIVNSIDISSYGNINSVAVNNGIVACAIENTVPEQNGFVVFFNTNGVFQKQVTVGALPDMITFNHAGTRVLTANEGQPNIDYSIDPEGSVSIIDISGGIGSLSQSNVTTALFTSFNSQVASLKASGVRIYGPGSTVAQDMEPEYITISEDDQTAYVALQENNAFAYVDLNTNTITSIKPLGFKDHSALGMGLDATNSGSNVNIANWPIKGMYLPDGMSHFNVGGVEYLITANEGDARADYGVANNEETSIGAATYSLDPTAFPFASVMKTNADLGKLKCTNRLGDTDNDGDFDEIYTFGARSFSIWNATTGTLVYDSGDDLEQITANDPVYGAMFNCSNTNITKKDRSDDKGPEPEGVAVATIAGNLYAFVSMERVGGLMVFNINNPAAPQFVQYVNNRGLTGLTGDRGPEGIIYITQPNSPTGKAYIVLGNEVSSSVSVYEIACPSSTNTVAASSTVACTGNILSVNSGTITGATYTWYNGTTIIPGATTAVYTATASGNYSVKLNNVGCAIPSNSVSLLFNALPSVSVAATSTAICIGNTVTLNAAGAQTYTYTSGINDGIAFTPTATLTYSVTGEDVNGCVNTASTSIQVNTLPTVSVVATSTVVCIGNTVTLNTTGAQTYTFTNGVIDGVAFTPTTTLTYSVTGEDINGCVNTVSTSITVNSLPTVSVAATSTAVCIGNTVTLNGAGAQTYTYTNGVTDGIAFTPTATLTYSVTGEDANGCINTASTSVTVNNLPTVSLSTASVNLLCASINSVALNGGSPSGGVYSGTGVTANAFSPSTVGVGNYTITYTYTDANGCENTDSDDITVDACTGIAALTQESFKIYPNPNNGNFMISSPVFPANITLYDVSGKKVMAKDISSAETLIDLSTMSNGIYQLNIVTEQHSFNYKVVISK